MTKAADSRISVKQRNILIVCMLASFFGPFMGSALNLSISDISRQFQCGATTVTWVVNAYTLTLAVACLPFGHLADTKDRKKLMVTAAAAFSLTCLLCAFAVNITLLIALRIIQGVASAMLFAVNIPLLLSVFPPSQRGRALGLSVTATYIGLSLGPVLGGFLNSVLGWRSIFALVFLVSLAVFFLAQRNIDPDTAPHTASSDALGNLLYIFSVALLLLGLSCWSSGLWAKLLVAISLPLFWVFVRHELQTDAPLMQVRLFAKDRAYTLSNLAALLNYGATFAISYSLSIFLQNVKGFPSSTAGLLLICQPLVMASVSSWAGSLSDRIAPYKLASGGMLLIAAGLLYFSFLSEAVPLAMMIVSLAVIGLGFGLFSSPNTNAVLSRVDAAHYGEANSILGTMRTLGQSSSMVLVMFIFGATLGNTVITEADPTLLTLAIRHIMQCSCVICVVGALISLVRGRTN